ncbi:hypothetical protein HS041_33975 [Planomonospora sp. ID67723]|uniref:hypothetical protein n=1 Tax=Planomonospora sp. ID67723 TaxID=2738134 RepID=UPI0018C3A2A7|nr:hypothetical protein [Planomonospora sp. ID67723]MBG0832710.1 hypothetical protein [Planomonospora sp. ID67723]
MLTFRHRTAMIAVAATALTLPGFGTVPAGAVARQAAPAAGTAVSSASHPEGGTIRSSRDLERPAAFDLVTTQVRRHGRHLVFSERVRGRAGSRTPDPHGAFAGSEVLSYVWPVSLDPSAVGFEHGSGVLALAATSHPDFDDTPLHDEDGDGRTDDDGGLWHAHWVVLVPDTTRPDGALKIRDIADGEHPRLPGTWPKVPLFLDSPGYRTTTGGRTVRVRVPLADLGFPATFRFDGVTAALRVNADLHDPLLRVENVFDVASGDLSLPGRFRYADPDGEGGRHDRAGGDRR